jgi:hypothetical protein
MGKQKWEKDNFSLLTAQMVKVKTKTILIVIRTLSYNLTIFGKRLCKNGLTLRYWPYSQG